MDLHSAASALELTHNISWEEDFTSQPIFSSSAQIQVPVSWNLISYSQYVFFLLGVTCFNISEAIFVFLSLFFVLALYTSIFSVC